MPTTDIKRFLPEEFKKVKGKNVPAILDAINERWESLEQTVRACIDQLFIQTATGRFLVQLGEQEGFTMPPNSGLDIRAYRTLVPIMVANPKQVRQTIDELIQAFYTTDKTKASITSSVAGPFVLSDGDDLQIETEAGLIIINIVEGQVSDLNNVSSAEIAAVINSTQSTIMADQMVDRNTALSYLRLKSSTPGAISKIKIVGGTLQNVLQFPTLREFKADSSTTWVITKTDALLDEVKFTWDGLGVNPDIYLARKDDTVTIRGLVDGIHPWSLLNGSYKIIDIGFDYFVIRNSAYDELTSTMTQPDDNNIIITSQDFINLYNNEEYALTSETSENTITVTVPAIPPLGRRFLSGSAHLHGFELQVLDFTRNTIKVQYDLSGDKPSVENTITLKNSRSKYDFRKKPIKTVSSDSHPLQPNLIIDTAPENTILPYTVPTVVGANSIWGEVDDSTFTVSFPFAHGLEYTWGFDISGAVTTSNILAADLNKEHQVEEVVDDNTLKFKLKTSTGDLKKFDGIAFGPVDVYQYASQQSDGADFYMQFGTVPEASVFTPGMTFRFNTSGGTNVIGYIANQLRYRKLKVVSVSGNVVRFVAGLGNLPFGLIVSGISGGRSGYILGTASYYLNKTSLHNQDHVMGGLTAIFQDYTPSNNPGYIGSFIYDPNGVGGAQVTVSKYIVKTSQSIFRGDNFNSILISSVTTQSGDKMPSSGRIVVDYGSNEYEGPIRYYAVVENPGANQILIDPAYKFKKSHKVGANIQYIHDDKVYVPKTDGTDLPFYLTGASQARNTMFVLAELLVAAGIFVEQDVLLPDLRYSDTSIEPFI